MRLCVIIPTYNEEKNIGNVLSEVKSQNLEVIIVDDGSLDNTQAVALKNGCTLLRNEQNEGKGASLIKGFNYALSKNFDAVITLDGDGQHQPSDIPYFIRLATYSESGIFIGNRMYRLRNMPLVRILTNKFMSWLISIVARQSIPDTQCGFRLIKRKVLEKVKLQTKKFETESEILIKAARMGFVIESVPIKTIYRGEKSQIKPFMDTLRFARFIVWQIFKKEVN